MRLRFLSVRGFDIRGIGPSKDGNSLGGTVYWASGLHLYTPLPFRPGKGGLGDLFKSHVFVTAGNVGNYWLSGHMGQDFNKVTENFRLSYGLGLALKLGGIARLELNYCVPVRVRMIVPDNLVIMSRYCNFSGENVNNIFIFKLMSSNLSVLSFFKRDLRSVHHQAKT